jgi:TolB-like protein
METFTPEKVRGHLQRVLQMPSFSDSIVLTRFLTFIVNETLEGRSHELKEYTIAIGALKKDTDFNPQIDSIVRIHAGRLRRALKEFYYEKGRDEEMQIVVRKGSYIPAFIPNHASSMTTGDAAGDPGTHLIMSRGSSMKNKASLAILPFEEISETKTHSCFIKGLDLYLSTCLTNNKEISVVSYLSSHHILEKIKDIQEAAVLLNASFILTGCVQFDEHLRIHILLSAAETGAQVWATTINEKDIEKTDLFLLQEEIVNKIVPSVNEVIKGFGQQQQSKMIFDGSNGLADMAENRKALNS